ncbi:MAG TPA: hypothetical protein VH496_11225 [Mycobacterium sp.]
MRALRWLPAVALLAMLLLGWAVGDSSTWVDEQVLYDIYEPGRPSWLLLFTDWHVLLPVLIGCVAGALYRRRWRLAVVTAVCPAVAILLVYALKRVFERHKGGALAYPSGHMTVVVVVTGLLVVVAGGRLWAVAVAIAVSVLGMLGLVLCGFHYLTDTVGAALLGTALVCLAAMLTGDRDASPG